MEVHKKGEWAIALKRLGKDKDVAHSVKFVVENDYMTGTGLRVDGGMVVPML